ncbi:unnamed protein product [Sphagnum troendelagicum]
MGSQARKHPLPSRRWMDTEVFLSSYSLTEFRLNIMVTCTASLEEAWSSEMLGARSLTVSFPQSNRADRSHPLPQREFGSNGGGGSGSYDSENRLFVGNLSWGVDDASLQTMFSDYGKVMDARVVYDRDTGRSGGFGFVTLSTAAEVNDAIQNLDGAVIIFSSGPDGGISPL